MLESLRAFLSQPAVLIVWLSLSTICVGIVWRDMRRRNPEIMSLMRAVWLLTVFYSGPVGLAVYFYSGRKQIAHDSLWRRGARSTAHCYSGCGAGEVAGLVIAVGILSLGTWWVAALTFACAYAAGYAMTVGPMVQEGVPLREALWDAFTSETASITVMEVVAIGTDIWLAGDAKMSDVLFWTALLTSLTAGFAAAYPVNVALVRFGVKSGMANPKDAAKRPSGSG